MKVTIFAVKDELTETFYNPIFIDERQILRLFETQINHTIWRDNPSDYSMYKLGEFDEKTGEIFPQIEKIAGGRSVWRKDIQDDLHTIKQTGNDTE